MPDVDRQRRRSKRTIAVVAVAFVVIAIVLGVIGLPMTANGGANIVDFERAGSAAASQRIFDGWDQAARDASWLVNVLDYAFMVSYGALGFLWARYVAARAADRGWAKVATLGRVVAVLAVVAAVSDAVENVGLLLQLHEGRGTDVAALSAAAANLKFALLYVLVVPYPLVVLLALRFTRARAAT